MRLHFDYPLIKLHSIEADNCAPPAPPWEQVETYGACRGTSSHDSGGGREASVDFDATLGDKVFESGRTGDRSDRLVSISGK